MKAKFTAFFLSVMLAVLPVAAQSRPGGGGQQGSSQGRQGAGQGQRGSEMGKGTVQRAQKHIHATTQQRDQIRACDQSADQIRQRARALARTAQRSGLQAGPMREQATQLRQQFHSMQQEHTRLMQSLDPEQRAALQDRIRNMEQLNERAEARLSTIESELGSTIPDGKRIAEQAREIERYMKDWQELYREMNKQMTTP